MTDFFKFIQQNRADTGLLVDKSLGEIYDSGERLALTNLLLDPNSLDQIYGLEKGGLSTEDVRTTGGLDKSVIHSLGISDKTLDNVSLFLSQKLTTDRPIGEPTKPSPDNIIVFHGGIAAKNIKYNVLDENGDVKLGAVSTSRESLFNSVKNEQGEYISASYPDLFRTRRRSHLNELRLSPNLFVEKGLITESPTDTLNLPIYMRTIQNSDPAKVDLRCYATKNSPLILPVKITTTAKITFFRKGSTINSPEFIYGWELKTASDMQTVLQQSVTTSAGIAPTEIAINTAGTVCDKIDCFLYIYLDPSEVTRVDLPNLGLTEQSGRDIGLLGFGVLQEFNISGNENLSTLPVWLKTLDRSFTTLNIRGTGFWKSGGIVRYFDWQEPPTGVDGSIPHPSTNSAYKEITEPPNIALTQFLGYSGYEKDSPTKYANYTGYYETMQDSSGVLYKNQRKLSSVLTGGTWAASTPAGTVIITSTNHGVITKNTVKVSNVKAGTGTVFIEKTYTATSITSSTFSIQADPTTFSATGGTLNWSKVPGVSLEDGFRPFEKINTLNLGSTVCLSNPDFSTLFPNLRTLSIDVPPGTNTRVLYGLIPKLNNNDGIMSINLERHSSNVGGSIRYLGDTITWNSSDTDSVKKQFIGQFKISYFNIKSSGGTGWYGGICTTNADISSGSVLSDTVDGLNKFSFVATGSAVQAWSGWLSELQTIDISYRNIAFKIASDNGSFLWEKLWFVECSRCGDKDTNTGPINKIEYNKTVVSGSEIAVEKLRSKKLQYVRAYNSGWYGRIFSIDESDALIELSIGGNEWTGYISPNGNQYLLPTNFAISQTTTSYQRLTTLNINDIVNSYGRKLEFRDTDLLNLPRLSVFRVHSSYITGKFPTVPPLGNNNKNVLFETFFYNCRFRDLSALGSNNASANRIRTISGWLNGTGVGGSLLPSFNSSISNNVLRSVNLNSTLISTYPVDNGAWFNNGDKGKLIGTLITGSGPAETTTYPGTWTSKNFVGDTNAPSDKLYQSVSGAPISQRVMVGDNVFVGTARIGRVTQIDSGNKFIYIDSEVSLTAVTLTFERAGQDISSYFNNHALINEVYLRSVRAVGTIPSFKESKNLREVDLSNNLLTTYNQGTLRNITGATDLNVKSTPAPVLSKFDLSNNPLTEDSIRKIIEDVHIIATYFRSLKIDPTITILLNNTNYNATTGFCQPWTKSKIFIDADDKLQTKFNQLGAGGIFPKITIQLF